MSAAWPPPGWYPDPARSGRSRWWSGRGWTAHTRPAAGAPASPASPVPRSAPTRARTASRRWRPRLLVGGVVALVALIAVGSQGIRGLVCVTAFLAVVVGIVAIARRRVRWARITSRGQGVVLLGVALVVWSVGASTLPGAPAATTASDTAPHVAPKATVAAAPAAATAPASVSAVPSPPATPTPTKIVVKHGTALALLAALAIKGRAPMTGYDRVGDFGPAWYDADHNGCDTRDDILGRDLGSIATSGCRVETGVLLDPYTGRTIDFKRGVGTSTAVQIDHVVSLGDAWQTGAQKLSESQRVDLANDPINLLAVDGPTNEAKGDGDTATWLPHVKSFRCTYVARQVSVKHAYHLWVTSAEKAAMKRVLDTCPTQVAYTSTVSRLTQDVAAPQPKTSSKPKPEKTSAPSSGGSADVYYKNCAAARAAGAAPIYRGQPGYRAALDRDGDGVACES